MRPAENRMRAQCHVMGEKEGELRIAARVLTDDASSSVRSEFAHRRDRVRGSRNRLRLVSIDHQLIADRGAARQEPNKAIAAEVPFTTDDLAFQRHLLPLLKRRPQS